MTPFPNGRRNQRHSGNGEENDDKATLEPIQGLSTVENDLQACESERNEKNSQAINPKLVHKELYTGKDMATANPTPGAWSATPFSSSITLYKPGQGWPTDFDQKKADLYYKKVVDKVRALVSDTFAKWKKAGFR